MISPIIPITLLALAIRQPWAELILSGGKDMENRFWSTRHRGPLLIHAAKALDEKAADDFGLAPADRGGIVGVARLVDVVRSSSSRWFQGPVGFALADPWRLPFRPLRGQQNLFSVSFSPGDPGYAVLARYLAVFSGKRLESA